MNDRNNVPNGNGDKMPEDAERQLPMIDEGTTSMINRAEVDQMVAAAHKYPRNLRKFMDEVKSLATLTTEIAEECTYALPRDGKTIIGPSARFAEILASCWGNCSAAARVVDDKGTYVVAQGVFMDHQKNTRIVFEVNRRIVDKKGRRYSEDMVGVTANAACSIALRNAVFKGVPKAFWNDLWAASRHTAIGDAKTLATRRAMAVEKLGKLGVTELMILAKLERASIEEVTLDDLAILLGCFTAIREGDSTVEQLFFVENTAKVQDEGEGKDAGAGAEALKKKLEAAAAKKVSDNGDAMRAAVSKRGGKDAPAPVLFSEMADMVPKAKNDDDLNLIRDLARGLPNDQQRKELDVLLNERSEQIAKGGKAKK